MAYNLEPANENVQRIAQDLARLHNGRGPLELVPVSESGMAVPIWLLFVSEAQKIWLAHITANNLDWGGRKIGK